MEIFIRLYKRLVKNNIMANTEINGKSKISFSISQWIFGSLTFISIITTLVLGWVDLKSADKDAKERSETKLDIIDFRLDTSERNNCLRNLQKEVIESKELSKQILRELRKK